tara:strand:- start:498 stop:869 length:372 start_codon:yes stop_codon:yes gene_type:complete
LKQVGHIFILIASSILLLHSFVPHHHHDELSEEQHFTEHSSASTAMELLGLIFHENLGEGHLENFENVEFHFDFDSPMLLVTTYFLFTENISVTEVCYLFDKQEGIPIPLYLEVESKRGPPTA